MGKNYVRNIESVPLSNDAVPDVSVTCQNIVEKK